MEVEGYSFSPTQFALENSFFSVIIFDVIHCSRISDQPVEVLVSLVAGGLNLCGYE